MRVGQNPAKSVKTVAKPERITVAVLNYIPFLSGFYAEMMDVLKVCLDSINQNTQMPFDLLVFDNGSCREVKEYLLKEQDEGRIQYLLLSDKNLGKGGAWNIILDGAPGEIIAYADNDCYFKPGWLKRSVEILETFPNVGMVTARPFRTKPELYSNTEAWARNEPCVTVKEGQLIPWEVYKEFNVSLGHGEDVIKENFDSSFDVRVTYKEVEAQIGSSHWQFTTYKSLIKEFLPFDMTRPMGQVRQLDQKINEAGYLRLMVPDPLVLNMSNTLINVPLENKKEEKTVPTAAKGAMKKRLLNLSLVKKPLLYLYNKIFKWYYFEQGQN
jgi:glycosyltransferase involved in cell wall biosynthesis